MPKPVHIVVLVHGLWGEIAHLKVMEDTLLETFGGQASPTLDASSSSSTLQGRRLSSDLASPDIDVRVLRVKGNENDKTYDGIDINACVCL